MKRIIPYQVSTFTPQRVKMTNEAKHTTMRNNGPKTGAAAGSNMIISAYSLVYPLSHQYLPANNELHLHI